MNDLRPESGFKLPPLPAAGSRPAPLAAPSAPPAPNPGLLKPLDQLLKPGAAGKALPQLELADSAQWNENKELSAFLAQQVKALGLGDASVMLVSLDKGEVAQVRPARAFYPASVIKLPVMAEAYHQAAAGKISLDQPVTVTAANTVDTWQPPGDTRPLLHAGSKATVRQLIELMITRSDNTATNTLIDLLGRDKITAYMRELGLPDIQVHRKLSVASDPIADGRNTMTGEQTARLLALIAQGHLVDRASSAAMLGTLGAQLDNDKIPAGLPKGAKVYHKTGETSQTTHDAAIIDWQGHRYVLSVFTNLTPGTAQPKITALTQKLWNKL